jgi:hypothetical protein
MTIDETLRKANVVLDVIDEQDSNCTLKKVMQEIISRWKQN